MPQHIMQRGIYHEACCYADEDHYCYFPWLKKSAADWGCAIHAYVLMTSHVHLLLTPETPDSPARLMQSRGPGYVHYFNRSYRLSGSLWEGRYRSSVVQTDNYLLRYMRHEGQTTIVSEYPARHIDCDIEQLNIGASHGRQNHRKQSRRVAEQVRQQGPRHHTQGADGVGSR